MAKRHMMVGRRASNIWLSVGIRLQHRAVRGWGGFLFAFQDAHVTRLSKLDFCAAHRSTSPHADITS